MPMWLVTNAEPGFTGEAHVFRADTEAEAAEVGVEMLLEDDHGQCITPETLGHVRVMFWDAVAYRTKLGVEKVPEEYQCCGGFPDVIGTTNEHAATCQRYKAKPEP